MSLRPLLGSIGAVIVLNGMVPVSFANTGSGAMTGSGKVTTGTGAIVPAPETDLQRGDRDKRTQGLRDKILQAQKKEKAYRDGVAQYLKKEGKLRSDCRLEMRKANRDNRFKIILRCERADLMERKELVRKQSTYIADTPGISPLIRANLRSRLDALLDALTTIVDGIDSGVYQSVDDLLETRKNLRERYQSPISEALSLLRADRALTWIALVIKDIDAVSAEEKTVHGEPRKEWAAGRTCLATQEKALQDFIDAEVAKGTSSLPMILAKASSCIDPLLDLPDATKPATGSGSKKAE